MDPDRAIESSSDSNSDFHKKVKPPFFLIVEKNNLLVLPDLPTFFSHPDLTLYKADPTHYTALSSTEVRWCISNLCICNEITWSIKKSRESIWS